MNLREYQELAYKTAVYPREIAIGYCTLGLTGEAGEIANKVKKYYRDALALDTLREQMRDELGDVLWYIATLAVELNLSLDDIARGNISKLSDRAARGTIKGSGDQR